jgi:hypothetical protein
MHRLDDGTQLARGGTLRIDSNSHLRVTSRTGVRHRHTPWKIEFLKLPHDVGPSRLGFDLLVDRTQDPRGIDVKGPTLRIESTDPEYTEAFRNYTLRITNDWQPGSHRRRKLTILLRCVEAHIEYVDFEVIQLLGAVTQRREFGRSARREGLRKPGDDDTPLSKKVGPTVQRPALPLEFEIRDARANFWSGRCRYEWGPSKNSSQERS